MFVWVVCFQKTLLYVPSVLCCFKIWRSCCLRRSEWCDGGSHEQQYHWEAMVRDRTMHVEMNRCWMSCHRWVPASTFQRAHENGCPGTPHSRRPLPNNTFHVYPRIKRTGLGGGQATTHAGSRQGCCYQRSGGKGYFALDMVREGGR